MQRIIGQILSFTPPLTILADVTQRLVKMAVEAIRATFTAPVEEIFPTIEELAVMPFKMLEVLDMSPFIDAIN